MSRDRILSKAATCFQDKLTVNAGAICVLIFLGALAALQVVESWQANVACAVTALLSLMWFGLAIRVRRSTKAAAPTNTQLQQPVPAIICKDE